MLSPAWTLKVLCCVPVVATSGYWWLGGLQLPRLAAPAHLLFRMRPSLGLLDKQEVQAPLALWETFRGCLRTAAETNEPSR